MTEVTYYEEYDEISIEIKGHAGYAALGSDIVCSAISTLGQTLLAYLNVDHEKFQYSMREGIIRAYAKGENVKTALHVIMAGFHLIEDSYPDYLKINRGCSMQRTP